MERKAVSGIMLTLLMMAVLTSVFNFYLVKAAPAVTITIKADGEVDPDTAPIDHDGDIYTFTDNITCYEILVKRSNITINGAGFVVEGNGTGRGFRLLSISNVTIKDTNIKGFKFGVSLSSTTKNTISRNNITNNDYGIWLSSSSNNTFSENNITNNNDFGVYFGSSSNNTLSGNVMNGNRYNFYVRGVELSHFVHSIDDSNFVNGKPVYYLVDQKDLLLSPATHPQVGFLGLINCDNAKVEGLTLTDNRQGLLLAYTKNSRITDNNITNNKYGIRLSSSSQNTFSRNNITNNDDGVWLSSSSNNTFSENNITNNNIGIELDSSSNFNVISGNNITTNSLDGIDLFETSNFNVISGNNITTSEYSIMLHESSNNSISGNIVTASVYSGIMLYESSKGNSISGNQIENNGMGIYLDYSSNYNIISVNNITNNDCGICHWDSSDNIISGNDITHNDIGIKLGDSSNNRFFHNNFVDNTMQVDIPTSGYANSWDNDYPSGGNYWSDYAGEDNHSGPNQDQPDSDGIGDTAHVIDIDNTDRYPLMNPYSPPTLTILSSPIEGVIFNVDDISGTTPWSGTYDEGISVSLVMPEIFTVGDARYYWSQWDDGNTTRSRTVIMDTDIMLTAQYTGPYYQLNVTSSPITGITLTIDGDPQTTPYIEWVPEGSYTLEMPETHDGYDWSHWLEDRDTNRIKSVTMDKSITLTGVFADITPPTISIHFPRNKTYTESNFPLLFIVSESTSWMGYSLDNQMNVTIYGNTTIGDLSNRIHTITVYANDTAGNMGSSDIVYFTVDTSIPDTFPPIVLIFSPKNKTYTTTDIPLIVEADETVSWMAYSLDNEANMTISANMNLSGLSDGFHSLIAYANDTAGNMGSSDIVYFTIDTVPPNIEILSPENKTYTTSSVSLTFTVDELTSWIGYSLDGQANVTIAGNTTLSGLSDGSHSLIVYANDTVGNIRASEIIYFSINTQQPEPFPIWIVAVIVIIAAFGTAIYLLKIRKES